MKKIREIISLYFEPVRDVMCFFGLHQVDKTEGVYGSGRCKHCGKDGLYF